MTMMTAVEAGAPMGPDASLLGVMATTRALRRLAPDPVPDELIRSIIEAAMWAPTGGNAQSEAFVVVTDRGTMARLAPLWRRAVHEFRQMTSAFGPRPPGATSERMRASIDYQAEHFAETPVLIVACYDLRPAGTGARNPVAALATLARTAGFGRAAALVPRMRGWRDRSMAGGIYPAVENLLLAARAHGLAACLTTYHLLAEEEFKAILGIPKEVTTYAVIPIGWPLDRFGPVRRRPVDEVIHRERW